MSVALLLAALSALPTTRSATTSPAPSVLVFAGGWGPESTQASIEAHAEQLVRALAPRRPRVLFGGPAADAREIQELDPTPDPLGEALARILERPEWIGVRYRARHIARDGAATKREILDALHRAASAPTIVFGIGHGSDADGELPARLDTWGSSDEALTLPDLRELLIRDRPARLALVLGQCHSGAFVELALTAPSGVDACVLAAVPADREAAGCSPDVDDPEAKAFVAWIGDGLARRIDVDGDGAVSLADAFAHARVEDRTIDVPVSSSEAWLRSRVRPLTRETPSPIDALIGRADPHDAFVLGRLRPEGSRTDHDVRRRWQSLVDSTDTIDQALSDAQTVERRLVAELRSVLLGRWPELANPLHRRARVLMVHEGDAILAELHRQPAWTALGTLDANQSRDEGRRAELEREAARLERWLRAAENTRLRARLHRRRDRVTLERLRACEATAVLTKD